MFNIIGVSSKNKDSPQSHSPASKVKTRETTLRCGVDTRVVSDIFTTEIPGAKERSGGVRHSANITELAKQKELDAERFALIEEQHGLRTCEERFLEELEVWNREFSDMHKEHEATKESLPALEVQQEQTEKDADEMEVRLQQLQDEYERFKQHRKELQEELKEVRIRHYQIQNDQARVSKAQEESVNVRQSQAHKEKSMVIERVEKKRKKLEQMRKTLEDLQHETVDLHEKVTKLSGSRSTM